MKRLTLILVLLVTVAVALSGLRFHVIRDGLRNRQERGHGQERGFRFVR